MKWRPNRMRACTGNSVPDANGMSPALEATRLGERDWLLQARLSTLNRLVVLRIDVNPQIYT